MAKKGLHGKSFKAIFRLNHEYIVLHKYFWQKEREELEQEEARAAVEKPMLPQHNIRKPYNYGIMFDPAGGSGRGQGGVTSSCIKHRWDQRVSLDFSFSGHNKRNNQRRELRWHMQREKGAGAGITESLSTPFSAAATVLLCTPFCNRFAYASVHM